MKVRMIAGMREGVPKDPLSGIDIWPVQFPMRVINYQAANAEDQAELSINDEDELIEWAEVAFDEMGYEIFTMEIEPAPPLPKPAGTASKIISLISKKKEEYEDTAPSTPEAEAERDAVVDALDTLEIHARDTLAGSAA